MANRLIHGEFQGDYVLRVSRPGHNVLDPNLPRQRLAFDSRWPETMQIAVASHVDIPQTGSWSMAHGLNYSTAPVAFMWADYNGQRYQLTAGGVYVWGTGAYLRAYVNTTHIHIAQFNSSVAFRLQYVLLRQSNG